jgi:hypothetical protein
MAESPTSYCPNCLAEYRPGFDTCADCGVTLVRGPAPVTQEHAPADTKHHAHPTEDRDQVPVALPDARMIRVWVLESQLVQARAIAERALSGSDAI